MTKNSLVLYKTQPAVIKETDGDKYIIAFHKGEQKVREKDVILLSDGPVTSLEKLLAAAKDDSLLQQFNSSLL